MLQDNVSTIVNYTGSIKNTDSDIREFIKEMEVIPLDKPAFLGTSAYETDKEIWKAQCLDYVKTHVNCKQSLHRMYNIIWVCYTTAMQNKMKKQPDFDKLSNRYKGWGHTK